MAIWEYGENLKIPPLETNSSYPGFSTGLSALLGTPYRSEITATSATTHVVFQTLFNPGHQGRTNYLSILSNLTVGVYTSGASTAECIFPVSFDYMSYDATGWVSYGSHSIVKTTSDIYRTTDVRANAVLSSSMQMPLQLRVAIDGSIFGATSNYSAICACMPNVTSDEVNHIFAYGEVT